MDWLTLLHRNLLLDWWLALKLLSLLGWRHSLWRRLLELLCLLGRRLALKLLPLLGRGHALWGRGLLKLTLWRRLALKLLLLLHRLSLLLRGRGRLIHLGLTPLLRLLASTLLTCHHA